MYYPVFLKVEGRLSVVIGGGEVARRKVEGLLARGARVRVVSPRAVPALEEWARQGRLELVERTYRQGDLAGAALAFAATGDPAVNGQVYGEGEAAGVPVNAADDPAHCHFIVPATVERGDLTIAISTAGQSPALARRLREELAARFGPEYAAWLRLLGEARALVQGRLPDPQDRQELLFRLVDEPSYLELLGKGREAEARRLIQQEIEKFEAKRLKSPGRP